MLYMLSRLAFLRVSREVPEGLAHGVSFRESPRRQLAEREHLNRCDSRDGRRVDLRVEFEG